MKVRIHTGEYSLHPSIALTANVVNQVLASDEFKKECLKLMGHYEIRLQEEPRGGYSVASIDSTRDWFHVESKGRTPRVAISNSWAVRTCFERAAGFKLQQTNKPTNALERGLNLRGSTK